MNRVIHLLIFKLFINDLQIFKSANLQIKAMSSQNNIRLVSYLYHKAQS
jgi:hypothetical protein